jgi:hypothetical protein
MDRKTVKGAPPVVFAFRPESYTILESADEITKWETMMKDLVGFNAIITNLSGTCCESSSGGQADDCDQD